LIVDDGSTDRTSKVGFKFVKEHKIDNVRVLLLGRNHGKGEAVRKVSVKLPAYFFGFK
jgi:dolichyl-phosphate beta-glucosyltransferase